MTFKNQKIIITGASSGIGKALALKALSEGAIVFGISHEAYDETFKHDQFTHQVYDLSKLYTIETILNQALKTLGGLDMLFLNAGMAIYKKTQNVSLSELKALYDLNTFSVITSYKWLLRHKKDNPFRCIVTSSVMAYYPFPGYSEYASSKAAIMTYFKAARFELNKHQTIHMVYPVATKTSFFKTSGQTHQSLMMQEPSHVANRVLKGIKRNRKNIYPSRLFEILYRILPFSIHFVIKREIKRLNQNNSKK